MKPSASWVVMLLFVAGVCGVNNNVNYNNNNNNNVRHQQSVTNLVDLSIEQLSTVARGVSRTIISALFSQDPMVALRSGIRAQLDSIELKVKAFYKYILPEVQKQLTMSFALGIIVRDFDVTFGKDINTLANDQSLQTAMLKVNSLDNFIKGYVVLIPRKLNQYIIQKYKPMVVALLKVFNLEVDVNVYIEMGMNKLSQLIGKYDSYGGVKKLITRFGIVESMKALLAKFKKYGSVAKVVSNIEQTTGWTRFVASLHIGPRILTKLKSLKTNMKSKSVMSMASDFGIQDEVEAITNMGKSMYDSGMLMSMGKNLFEAVKDPKVRHNVVKALGVESYVDRAQKYLEQFSDPEFYLEALNLM